MNHTHLERIGLSEKEAKVYLAALSLGPSTISSIAKKSGIKRTTVYEIIKSLLHQQLVSLTAKGKRKHYLAAEPEALQKIIQKKEVLLNSVLPELKALSLMNKQRPTVKVFEGIDGIKAMYQDTLDEGQELLAFLDFGDAPKELAEWLDNTYIKKRMRKGMHAKVIAPDSPESKRHRKLDLAHNRETHLINQKEFPFSVEINTYGNKTAFMSFRKEELFGVIIESPQITKTMKTIFTFFWKHTS